MAELLNFCSLWPMAVAVRHVETFINVEYKLSFSFQKTEVCYGLRLKKHITSSQHENSEQGIREVEFPRKS